MATNAPSRTYSDHAWLYDLAFDWDVSDEVAWLCDRLGRRCRRLLEPGCGSGRMFPAFDQRGVRVVGLDRSLAMLARARQRLAAVGLAAPVVCGDMAHFAFARPFDGAYCPVGTLGYLTTDAAMASHLEAVASSLVPGAAYLVQLDLVDLVGYRPRPPDRHSDWEVATAHGTLRTSCFGESWDPSNRIETQICRFAFTSGRRAGSVFEDRDPYRLWDWASWSELVAGSPFTQVGADDGSRAESHGSLVVGPELEGRRLVWHELRRTA